MRTAEIPDREQNSDRVPSLDLLKIISMLMIIFYHLLNHGNLLEFVQVEPVGLKSALFQFINSLCSVGVNCFVLISGYFLSTKPFKIKRLVSLWISVEFYSVVLFVLSKYIMKIPTGGGI